MKKISLSIIALALPLLLHAQSGTNSPYSQYAYGLLSDRSQGFSRGMDGLGLAFSDGKTLNNLNPASYSRIDSLTFIFDMGVSGQVTNFSESGKRVNANNATFEYAVGGLRLMRGLGLSFGLLPYTNVGYNYSVSGKVAEGSATTSTSTYDGSGGLHQVFLGMGYSPWKPIAVGVNVGYLWGDIDRYVSNSFSDTYMNTLTRYTSMSLATWTLELGLQYHQPISKRDEVNLGLTFSLGHKISGDPETQIISQSTASSTSDTATVKLSHNLLRLPHTIGAGLMWNHNNALRVGVDYHYMRYSTVNPPAYSDGTYAIEGATFSDRHKVTAGLEYTPDRNAFHNFLKRVSYRIGASYATPYYKINGADGPREYSVSAGFGIPVINRYNTRSVLNISGQWVNREAKGLIRENTFRINIGFTFNERWFAKWKAE